MFWNKKDEIGTTTYPSDSEVIDNIRPITRKVKVTFVLYPSVYFNAQHCNRNVETGRIDFWSENGTVKDIVASFKISDVDSWVML